MDSMVESPSLVDNSKLSESFFNLLEIISRTGEIEIRQFMGVLFVVYYFDIEVDQVILNPRKAVMSPISMLPGLYRFLFDYYYTKVQVYPDQ